MKTISALFLGLSSSVLLISSAAAESFNDRGENFMAAVPTDSRISSKAVEARSTPFNAFNERGENWHIVAPAGSQAPRQPVTTQPNRFNNI